MSTVTNLPTLGNTIRDTQHFSRNASLRPEPPTYRSSVVPGICLPDPPSLYPFLLAVGAEEMVAKEMDRAYHARALELRSYYEKSISNAFAAITETPFPHESEKRILDAFATLYLTKVKSWIEDGLSVYQSSRKPAKQVASNAEVSKSNPRRAFNTVCPHLFPQRSKLMIVDIGLCSPSGRLL